MMRTVHTQSPTLRLMIRYLHAYRQVFFYGLLFLAGVLAGAVFLKSVSAETLQTLSALVERFTQSRGRQDLVSTFLSSFSTTAVMLLVLFLCGFCAIAQPVVVVLPFFRGLGFGYQAGYFYASYGFVGMGYVSLLLLPHVLLSTLVLIYGCGEAFTMSAAYYQAARQGGVKRPLNLRAYCSKFLVLLLLAALVAALDATLSAIFGGLFPTIVANSH